MDEKTRQVALEKINEMKSIIAYPDELLNVSKIEELYQRLEVTSSNHYELSIKNLTRFHHYNYLRTLRNPIEKGYWTTYAVEITEANAFFSLTENIIGMHIFIN